MPIDYDKIREEKRKFDDPEIQDLVRTFVVDSYADQTHFILELLQNAEDAMRKRDASWHGNRAASFSLTQHSLRVNHYGKPFNEDDVRSICSVGRSSKQDLTTIGRFGIGFKSVFRFTDSPQVHSGDEDFVIKRFVLPKPTHRIDREQEETVFLFPLDRHTHIGDYDFIRGGLADLGERALLFLRDINELQWEVEGCDSGHYIRDVTKEDGNSRQVNVIGRKEYLKGEETDFNEEWIVFSREVQHDGKEAGYVEIAFCVDEGTGKVRKLEESKLVVYFPTAVETHLGFLVQGPYRTTPNRENVPPEDGWNQDLVAETSVLIGEALRWLRDRNKLKIDVLCCLPLNRRSGILAPLFHSVLKVMNNEAMLPKHGGGYVAAQQALMARTSGLLELFSADQISQVLGEGKSLFWLDDSVRRDSEVLDYVAKELDVRWIRPERLMSRLTADFLEKQSDDWIARLYSFLKSVPNAINLQDAPALIRLEDGTHVPPFAANRLQAWLPREVKTGFPTVKASICKDAKALQFLKSIGLKQPDLVDDVEKYVLPKYKRSNFDPDVTTYESDVGQIVSAYRAANTIDRMKLVRALREVAWVKAIDFGDGLRRRMSPDNIYLPTDSLRGLLSVVAGFMFVDQKVAILMSEEVQQLLKDCGAVDHLRPVDDHSKPSEDELRELRRDAGHEHTSGRSDRVSGFDLREIEELVYEVRKLDTQNQEDVARGLWRELKNLHHICGDDVFERIYVWTDSGGYRTKFDANFLRKLNSSSWIPTQEGQLRRPSDVLFSELGWDEDHFLQSKIQFKPPKIHELANEAGFEPDVLELLKRRNLTTISKLREVGIIDDQLDGNGRSNEAHEARDDGEPFAKQLFHMQSKNPTPASDQPILIPDEGPKTATSAKEDALQSRAIGGSGTNRRISVSRWTPTEAADTLAARFKQMVYGDYGKRCQVCSNAFTKLDGEMQVFVMHIVPPSNDGRANNFGDLIGVCGWHHALIKYGEWQFDFPTELGLVSERETFDDWPNLRASILAAQQTVDEHGNIFVSIPIQFSNVFREWASQPANEKAVIRYSVPHWKYLCELLKV